MAPHLHETTTATGRSRPRLHRSDALIPRPTGRRQTQTAGADAQGDLGAGQVSLDEQRRLTWVPQLIVVLVYVLA